MQNSILHYAQLTDHVLCKPIFPTQTNIQEGSGKFRLKGLKKNYFMGNINPLSWDTYWSSNTDHKQNASST